MAFGTILTIVIIGYILLYGGMIIYDVFFKKTQEGLIPKPEDEDIDISDEARQFHPVYIEKECKPGNGKKNGKRAGPPNTRQSSAEEKDIREGKPISEETQESPRSQAAVLEDADEEPPNRRSLNDIGEKATRSTSTPLTDEEKEKLDRLNKEKEEKLRQFRGDDKSSTPKTAPPTTDTSSQEDVSDTQSQNNGADSEAKPKKRHYESARKEMQVPEGHKANIFEPTVRIPDDAGQTKICNAQTVEDLHEEVKRTLADDMAFSRKALESLWVKSKLEMEEPVSEEDILKPPEQEDGTARKAATFDLPT